MRVTFTFKEFARDGIGMGKMAHGAPARFQNYFFITIQTSKRPITFEFQICEDGLPVCFSLGGKHTALL